MNGKHSTQHSPVFSSRLQQWSLFKVILFSPKGEGVGEFRTSCLDRSPGGTDSVPGEPGM